MGAQENGLTLEGLAQRLERLERVMNFEQALLGSDCGGEVAAWKGLEHRWALRAGCG